VLVDSSSAVRPQVNREAVAGPVGRGHGKGQAGCRHVAPPPGSRQGTPGPPGPAPPAGRPYSINWQARTVPDPPRVWHNVDCG